MSVRHALLALLSEGPKYGLQLRQEFEARTGEVWPLNVGQVYTTLQRLERDGLVESDDADDEGPQKGFRITAGRRATSSPMAADPAGHGVAAARRAGDQGAGRAAGAGRRRARAHPGAPPAPGRADAALHPLKEDAPSDDVGLALVVDAELFRLDAVVRWLDAADARLTAPARPPARAPAPRRAPARRDADVGAYGDDRGARAAAGVEVYGDGRRRGARAASTSTSSVDAGELVAIMGPSGSGKSTLLTIAGTLEEPTTGEVLVGGPDVSAMSRNDRARLRRRSIGYVFQDFNLLAGLTAVENVALPLELDGMRRAGPRAAGAGRRSTSSAWPTGPATSRRPLGRRAPAGGHRPRRRRRPPPAARRRADRRARLGQRRGGHAAAAGRLQARAWPGSSSPTTRSSRRGPTGSCSSATAASSTRPSPPPGPESLLAPSP